MSKPNINMVMSALLAEQVLTESRNVNIDSDRFEDLDDIQLQNVLDWLFEVNYIQGYVAMENFFIVQMYPLED